ncbi:hypothetical protein EEL30_26280 [Brevibacillus laterosporus]|uniref:Exo-alpha-sialidase n=1 Tax=Brevibacillus laterosporus TaxID=1465 RepID=A0A518VEN8_BRELA|nr:hypothetical protein EEL30_26280 [Brevibacillus laterosporus]
MRALALAVLVPTAAFAATTPQSGAKMTVQTKTENGVPFYSTDKGKTWNKSLFTKSRSQN